MALAEATPLPLPSQLLSTVEGVLLGKARQVEMAIAAMLGGCHVLVEDEPGVGKTVLATTIARAIGGGFGRVQGSPDLLPSDVLGVHIFDSESQEWVFHRGPVFNNVVLFDELNRTTPRAQSALLEAMAENQVSVDGTTFALPQPFFVIATQNPSTHAGTFPLVEGQRDRFDVAVSLGLPDREVERSLLMGHGGRAAIGDVRPVVTAEGLASLQAQVRQSYVAEPVVDYALDLVGAIRSRAEGTTGLSTRAAQSLLRVARGVAALRGRGYAIPDDVRDAAPFVFAHRAQPTQPLASAEAWVRDIVKTVAAPTGS